MGEISPPLSSKIAFMVLPNGLSLVGHEGLSFMFIIQELKVPMNTDFAHHSSPCLRTSLKSLHTVVGNNKIQLQC